MMIVTVMILEPRIHPYTVHSDHAAHASFMVDIIHQSAWSVACFIIINSYFLPNTTAHYLLVIKCLLSKYQTVIANYSLLIWKFESSQAHN